MKRTLIIIGSLALVVLAGVYIRQVIHETIQSPQLGQHYVVALGDSVAAGDGLGGNNGAPGACNVAAQAFPYLLATAQHEQIQQFACSGATVAKSSTADSLLGDQYPAAKSFISGNDVVVYAGANDIDWLNTLASCISVNCATAKTASDIDSKLAPLKDNLTNLLGQVQQSHPRNLVVNTYYDLFAAGDTCLTRAGVTAQEVDFIRSEETKLNSTITAAATAANATVVHIDFSGHTLCSAQPWIQNVAAAAPLHPTIAGQQHIAAQDALALIKK